MSNLSIFQNFWLQALPHQGLWEEVCCHSLEHSPFPNGLSKKKTVWGCCFGGYLRMPSESFWRESTRSCSGQCGVYILWHRKDPLATALPHAKLTNRALLPLKLPARTNMQSLLPATLFTQHQRIHKPIFPSQF